MARRNRQRTPWGTSQYAYDLGGGFEFHVTATHGGIKVPERHRSSWAKEKSSFSTRTWAEEDCDAVRVIRMYLPVMDKDKIRDAFPSLVI